VTARPSPQVVDPLGAAAARPVTLAAALAALAVGAVATVVGSGELTRPVGAVLALVGVAAAGVVLYLASSPLRAPFRTGAVVAVVVLAALAHVASAWATWGGNPVVRDDWVPLATGVLVLGLCPYRRGRDVLLAGVASAGLVAAVTLVQLPWFTTPVPDAVFVVVAVTPVLALAAAGAAFSTAFVGEVLAWRDRASGAREAALELHRTAVARSVQQDRVTVLNREVVPFFAEVLERGGLTADDVARATVVADRVRAALVEEAERTWLEALLASPARPARATVDDPGALAAELRHEQRTVLRALLGVLGEGRLVDDVHVAVGAEGHRRRVVVRAAAHAPEAVRRQQLAPWVAVLRVVFDDVRLDASPTALTLEFSYDQH